MSDLPIMDLMPAAAAARAGRPRRGAYISDDANLARILYIHVYTSAAPVGHCHAYSMHGTLPIILCYNRYGDDANSKMGWRLHLNANLDQLTVPERRRLR